MKAPHPRSDEPRINRRIHAPTVRLIDEHGQMVGVVAIAEALTMAETAGLDLIEVSPNAEPPVCKIYDYGKYKYAEQKKAAEARKKQKVVVLKEIKLRPTIDKNDFDIKMKSAHKFLEEGDKVKVSLRFRGREMSHIDLARQLMQRVKDGLSDTCKIEMEPRVEGRQMIMMLSPLK